MAWFGSIRSRPSLFRARRTDSGVTLIELLCVIIIICILLSMLMPTLSRAYHRVKDMSDEWNGPAIENLLLKETRGYCAAHPQYRFDTKADFANKCQLNPKCRDWVSASSTDFVPFSYLTPTNQVVLTVRLGRKSATVYSFTRSDLSTRPPQQ